MESVDKAYLDELGIDENFFIISQTDERGIITACNKNFSKISGYNEKDLIGKPHNIIRHQDMPKSAFEDMWNVLQMGEVWRGYVKNKKKNGRFYWVFAIIFPYKLQDGTKCFKSYRRQASTKEIKEAMKLMEMK